MIITGKIVDLVQARIFSGSVEVEHGQIRAVREHASNETCYILPGFIDAHVHIESSMLAPSEFARLAVVHGTVATVSDPHEIGNVLGVQGVHWMIENGRTAPLKFFFGAPSCVPATPFETAGAEITAAEVEELLRLPDIRYLSEMMNFPGVLNRDPVVHAKLEAARRLGKVIDGHAPGLRGEEARLYASFGISTDHECFSEAEARDKLAAGMSILIREGSAAKNFEALIPLLEEFPEKIMFCSDDKHPNDLVRGHIDELVRRSIRRGIEPMKALRAASLNPIKHYGLPVGLLQEGDSADFIVVDNLQNLQVISTFIAGELVAEAGQTKILRSQISETNNFCCEELQVPALRIPCETGKLRVIEALDGQLITKERFVEPNCQFGFVESDTKQDVLKLAVVNRYRKTAPAIAFVSNFGLQEGALASSVAHDSHNIVAVGTNDRDLCSAINAVIEARGGISAVSKDLREVLELPIAGLMSPEDGYVVASRYEALDALSKSWGARLPSPYMTLSFLALLVIPELKLSDRGLFDGRIFEFTSLFSSD